jgi:hypothetical protein
VILVVHYLAAGGHHKLDHCKTSGFDDLLRSFRVKLVLSFQGGIGCVPWQLTVGIAGKTCNLRILTVDKSQLQAGARMFHQVLQAQRFVQSKHQGTVTVWALSTCQYEIAIVIPETS